MRNAATRAWMSAYAEEPFLFLTGDLGYNALESLRDEMQDHFINAGIAEQNMVSVAAGLATQDFDVWCYSIAPFCYARPFEQIRNDVCQHDLPVKLVGNGGGYAYGAMGSSHHALEDYGTLLTLPNMHVYVPSFAGDLPDIVTRMRESQHPAYLRLGHCEVPDRYRVPAYAPWRRLAAGNDVVILTVGPIAGALLAGLHDWDGSTRPEVWSISELPLESNPPPLEFLTALERNPRLCVVEEHVAQGSVGQIFAHFALKHGIPLEQFDHLCALGYPSGRYGSQNFHRKECGLDAATILKRAEALVHRV